MRDDDRILEAYKYLHPNYSPPLPKCYRCGDIAEIKRTGLYWCEWCWEFLNPEEKNL